MRWLLLAALGCSQAQVSAVRQAQWSAQPNVLLIVLDDFGITSTSGYGGVYQTPELDALATAGVKFTRGLSQPICGVSRAALLSGLYPERTRVIDHNHLHKYDTTLYTLPKAFRDAGYSTHLAGKWQLGSSPLDTTAEGDGYGWDTWLAWNTGSARYYGATHNRNGTNETYLSTEFGPDFLQTFVADTIDAATGPWFVYYSMTLVHDQGSPAYVAPPGSSATTSADKYRDMVAYADMQIGALVDVAGPDTLILVVGDNGSFCGSAVTRTIGGTAIDGCKGGLLEGGVRVPLIAHWPGVLEPAVSDRVIDLTDVWPTLAEIAGLPMNATYDGASFARELAGVYSAPRPWSFVQLGEHPSCYLRGTSHKVTCSGACTDLANAPFSETSATGAVYDALSADLAKLTANMGIE